MRRTTISLPDDLVAALEREASRRRVSVSRIARGAIERELGWDAEQPREIPFVGMFDSGGQNLAEYVDSDEFKTEFADWAYGDAFNRDP